jgi:hypothetical protein
MFRRLHAISVGTDLALIESLSLRLAYIYRRKDFTSELLGDTHLNRHDDNHQGMAEFRYRLNQAATLSASFQRTQRNSTVVIRDLTTRSIHAGEAVVLWPSLCVPTGGLSLERAFSLIGTLSKHLIARLSPLIHTPSQAVVASSSKRLDL